MIAGKHAVVTGGTRGIGLAIARALYDKGVRVSTISRTAGERTAGFFHAPADITDERQLTNALTACRREYGRVCILVNNSGIAQSAPFKRTDRAMWDRTIATNLTGVYLCTHLVVDEMLAANWGRIVNVASIAGLYGAPYISAYAASKHGVMGLTRCLAAELADSGVTVNAICPGYTQTDMMRKAIENIVKRSGLSEHAARAQLAQANPGGRIVTAEEVAEAAITLCEGERNGAEIVLPA